MRLTRLVTCLLSLALASAASAQPSGDADDGAFRCDLVEPDASARGAAPSLGTVRLLVVRPRFLDDPEEPPTLDPDEIEGWFDRVSYGEVDLEITIAPVVELAHPRSYYDAIGDTYRTGEWVREMNDRLDELGLPSFMFDITAVLAQLGPPFDLSGATALAAVGGRNLWSSRGDRLVMAHEIGHTMGLRHAGRYTVEDGDPFAGDQLPYANPFDTMGNVSAGDYGAVSKAYLGWAPPVLDIGLAFATPEFDPIEGGAETVRLYAIDGDRQPVDAAGLAVDLRDVYEVPRLRLEVRREVSGVLVHRGPAYGTTLLDATPGGGASDGSYHLPVGGRFELRDFFPGRAPTVTLEVTAEGEDDDGLWKEVTVRLGPWLAANMAPEIRGLTVSPSTEETLGTPIRLASSIFSVVDESVVVDYFLEGEWRPAERMQPPYSLDWLPSAPGAYSILARATNVRGQTTIAPPLGMLVRDPEYLDSSPIGQAGVVLAQAGQWTRVDLAAPLSSPTVVVQAVGDVPLGPSPDIRVRNVEGRSFEVQASLSAQPVRVAYLAVSAGTHRLPDGTPIQVGATAPADGTWERVELRVPGEHPPAVFTGAVEGASGERVQTRLRAIDRDAFEVQAVDGAEPIGYLAVGAALIPAVTERRRMEVGLLELDAGQGTADLRQSYGFGPGVLIASVQHASSSEPFDVVLEASGPASARVRGVSAGAAETNASVAFVALGLSGQPSTYAAIMGHTMAADTVPAPSGVFRLAIAPNPTPGASTLTVDLPDEAELAVVVVDVLGREVARLSGGSRSAGVHTLPLPGSLAAGTYLVRARAGADRLTARLTVLR